jgi:glycosyltransferase involved in cell wall biosynthesis
MRVSMLVQNLRRPASGGTGTYARGLLQGLDSLDPRERPEVELTASRAPRSSGSRGGPDPLAELGHPLRISRLPGPLLTRAWDHGLVRAAPGCDVVHTTSLATVEPGGAALVAAVHDLLWQRVPEAYPARGRRWHDAALRRALRRAERFIVPADAVADDLREAGAPPDTVIVIPMGSDHLPPPDPDSGAALLSRLGVDGPFLLSVGTLEPRKNLRRLIGAYGRIRSELPEPWPLVVVGPEGWGEPIVSGPGVVLTGAISPPQLSALYATTRLLAYVPLVEGFGLPPVEAMAFGAPVVASPLPSTAGAAFEVDPRDIDSIAHGLLVVATDEGERARLVLAGSERAGELTWSSAARRHLAVWHEVAGAVGTVPGASGD